MVSRKILILRHSIAKNSRICYNISMEVTYIMDYKKNLSAIQHEKLKVILSDLPSFCRDYFDYCDGTLNRSTATMLEYAYDVRSYFK